MKNKKKYIKKIIVADTESTPDARASRLRRLRNMANLNRQQMCDDEHLNINTYKGWEIARYGGLPQDGAERVVKRVSREGVICTVDWLLFGKGQGPYVTPGYFSYSKEEKNDEDVELIMREIMLFQQQFSNTTFSEIQDDGMEPRYKLGDIVAGIRRFENDINSLINSNCIIQTETGEVIIRRLKKGTEKNKYMLSCINSHTKIEKPIIYDVKLIYAAPIIRHYIKDSTF